MTFYTAKDLLWHPKHIKSIVNKVSNILEKGYSFLSPFHATQRTWLFLQKLVHYISHIKCFEWLTRSTFASSSICLLMVSFKPSTLSASRISLRKTRNESRNAAEQPNAGLEHITHTVGMKPKCTEELSHERDGGRGERYLLYICMLLSLYVSSVYLERENVGRLEE
jgi:hypothetical protein